MENQNYKHKTYFELELEAINKRKESINQSMRRLEGEIAKYNYNKDWGKESLEKLHLELENCKQQLALVEKMERDINEQKDAMANQALLDSSKSQIIDTIPLKLQNGKYEKNNDKIEKMEEAMAEQQDLIDTMQDGKFKKVAEKKYMSLQKKVEKLKKKNIRLEGKQVERLYARDNVRRRKEIKRANLQADAVVYQRNMHDAQKVANMAGVSAFERMKYNHQAKKSGRKYKRAIKKLSKLKVKKVKASSANNLTMAKRIAARFRNLRRQTQKRHP